MLGATTIMADGRSNWLKVRVRVRVRVRVSLSLSLSLTLTLTLTLSLTLTLTWLKGLVLVAAYVVLAAAFFLHEDPPGVNGATWDNKDVLPGVVGVAGGPRTPDDDDGPDDD